MTKNESIPNGTIIDQLKRREEEVISHLNGSDGDHRCYPTDAMYLGAEGCDPSREDREGERF